MMLFFPLLALLEGTRTTGNKSVPYCFFLLIVTHAHELHLRDVAQYKTKGGSGGAKIYPNEKEHCGSQPEGIRYTILAQEAMVEGAQIIVFPKWGSFWYLLYAADWFLVVVEVVVGP